MKYLDFNYQTSKDYERLFELIQKERVVCFVNTKPFKSVVTKEEIIVKDVCVSSFRFRENEIVIYSRGIIYINAFLSKKKTLKEDFIEQCISRDLEFIDSYIIN